MRLESENVDECRATAELIRELVRDESKRGEFMIMMDDVDEERFVQVACDYDETVGKRDECFDLEFREGKSGKLYHCTRRISVDEAEHIFLEELEGCGEWRNDYVWECEEGCGSKGYVGTILPRSVKIWCCMVAVTIVIVLLGLFLL